MFNDDPVITIIQASALTWSVFVAWRLSSNARGEILSLGVKDQTFLMATVFMLSVTFTHVFTVLAMQGRTPEYMRTIGVMEIYTIGVILLALFGLIILVERSTRRLEQKMRGHGRDYV